MTDGALLLDKPAGISSNRALQEARKLYGMEKAGHAGTLDPLATGLLVVLFGEATKFAGPSLDSDKEYVATLKLGERTSTGDAEGELLEQRPVDTSEAALQLALARFRGDIDQLPPMHSALKQGGVPLYKLARKGQTVERMARRVRILALESTRFEPPFVDIRVRCTKGTYVRTLAEDIGTALGTGAHISALRRTSSGRFHVADALSLEALQAMAPAALRLRLLPLAALLEDLPRAELDAAAEARLRNGQVLQVSGLKEGVHGVFGPGGTVIGLGSAENGGVLRALRLTQVTEKHVKSRA